MLWWNVMRVVGGHAVNPAGTNQGWATGRPTLRPRAAARNTFTVLTKTLALYG